MLFAQAVHSFHTKGDSIKMSVITFRPAVATQATPQKQPKFGMWRFRHPQDNPPLQSASFLGPTTDVFEQAAPRGGEPEVSVCDIFTQYRYPNRTVRVYKNNSNEEIQYTDHRKETRYANDSNIRFQNPATGVNTLYHAASGNITFNYPYKVKVIYHAQLGAIEFQYDNKTKAVFDGASGNLMRTSPVGWISVVDNPNPPNPNPHGSLVRAETELSDRQGIAAYLGLRE